MTRTCRAPFRSAGVSVCAVVVTTGLLLGTPGLAAGEPSPTNPDTMAALIADVAEANQKLQDIGASVQGRQESVNKAIVDIQTAREEAETAKLDVEASQRAVADANAAIAGAQDRFDRVAVTAYVHRPPSYLTAANPDEVIATASVSRALAINAKQVLTTLQRSRTEMANKESAARAAQQKAELAVTDTQRTQDAAVAALTDAQREFAVQQAEVNRLITERDAAQARLNAARATITTMAGTQAAPIAPADRWDPQAAPGTPAPAADSRQWDTPQWDPTLPQIPSAFVSGDPIAIINTLLGMSATSTQVTQQMGRNFLTQLGILRPADSGITNGQIPRVYGRQATEFVIRRGMSQMGVPYSWGGGNAAGPSRGIDSGAGTVGFDCSGLLLYAFAGVGIKLPHYSGDQYAAGRKVPSSQMRRGDLIAYGPNASQHIAMYLGDGQMLEAPYTGSTVKISPVRTSGMMPYVARLIEW